MDKLDWLTANMLEEEIDDLLSAITPLKERMADNLVLFPSDDAYQEYVKLFDIVNALAMISVQSMLDELWEEEE